MPEQKASRLVGAAGLKKVTVEIDDNLCRKLIFDYGDEQVAIDEAALVAATEPVQQAGEVIADRIRAGANAAPGSWAEALCKYRDELLRVYESHAAGCEHCGAAQQEAKASAN